MPASLRSWGSDRSLLACWRAACPILLDVPFQPSALSALAAFAGLWGRPSHQPGWLDRYLVLSCLAQVHAPRCSSRYSSWSNGPTDTALKPVDRTPVLPGSCTVSLCHSASQHLELVVSTGQQISLPADPAWPSQCLTASVTQRASTSSLSCPLGSRSHCLLTQPGPLSVSQPLSLSEPAPRARRVHWAADLTAC